MNRISMQSRTSSLISLELRAVRVLAVLCGSLVVAYIYFACITVFHAVAHNEAVGRAEAASSRIALLESEYFARAKSLTEDRAVALGLSTIADTYYVTRSTRLGSAHGLQSEI